MSEKVANIAKNTSYFTFALILQKIISFTYFTIIARALGPADLGKYYFAISFTAIFAIINDLGLTSVLTREIAKYQANASRLLGSILTLKLPLILVNIMAVILFTHLFDYNQLLTALIYLSLTCTVLDSFTATFFSVSRGFHNLSFESIASVVYQLIVLLSGLIILKINLGLRFLMLGLVTASIFNFVYAAIIVWKKWGLDLRPKFEPALVKLIVKIALSFGLFAIFQRIYTYLDSVLLQMMAGDYYVGIYQIAFKIINALQFLPLAFTASLYPAMSAYWAGNRGQLVVTFERAMNYLIIIALPIAIGIAVLADKVVLLFKAGYGEAILPLRINMASLLFLFVAFPVGSLLNACDKQFANTVNMAITMSASIVLNLILIPRFQAVGASLTVAITTVLMLVLGLYWVPRIIKVRPKKILGVLFKSLVATMVMALSTWLLKDFFNIFIVVIVSSLVYFMLLFLLGGFDKQDLVSIYRSFKKQSIKDEPTATFDNL